jgi:hypothetical protein
VCENAVSAERELGTPVAEALRRRLADLRAAKSVADLVTGSPRRLDGPDSQSMAITLDDGRRLVFSANHPAPPLTDQGDLDWSRVSRVKIQRIETDS